MSIAMQENGSGGFVADGFPDEAEAIAVARRSNTSNYDPHEAAYRPNPANDQTRKFAESIKAGATIELNLACIDGRREIIKLNARESAVYATSDIDDRITFGNGKIRERRQNVAVNAALRIMERGEAPSRHTLSPEEEACLREFGALEGKGRSMTLRESVRDRIATASGERLREDGFFDGYGNTNSAFGQNVAPTQREYLPRGGPSGQQQTLADRWDMLALSYYAWTTDPIAHRGCEVIADFTLGRGVQVVAKHPAVQRVIDEFFEREQINERLHQIGVSLSRDGNLFARKMPIGDGRMKVRFLPPASIWEIVTDGDDATNVFFFAQRYQTRTLTIGNEIPAAQTRWIERTLLASEVQHTKINASETDVFGKSDIYSALAWLKRLRDYFDAVVQAEFSAAAYQYHYKVKGGQADVSRIASAVSGTRPTPGEAMVTNDLVDLQAISSGQRGVAGNDSTYAALINHVAVAFGLSKDYFGVTGHSNRASALIATEPAAKRFEDRQDVMEGMLKRLLGSIVDEARKYGKLVPQGDEDTQVDDDFRIIFPTIIKADAATRLAMLRQLQGMGWLSARRAAQEAAGEVELSEYNYDEEIAAIEEETGEDPRHWIMRDVSSVKRGLPTITDVAFPGETPNPADAQAATLGDAGNASPTSATGAAKIRNELGSVAGGLRASERTIAESGGIVIYP